MSDLLDDKKIITNLPENQELPERKTEPEFIFRPWITLKDGSKLWAKSCGKKAFKIPVSPNH